MDKIGRDKIKKPDNGDGLSAKPGLSSVSVDFFSWCGRMVPMVLRTRTAFSAFFSSTMHLPRSSLASTSALFPLPVPFIDAFKRMPPGVSSQQRRKIYFNRFLNLLVAGLNFWWSNEKFLDLELLGRTPNSRQLAVFRRLRSLVLADGRDMIATPIVSCGRKFPQLVARLTELSGALTCLGAESGPYSKSFAGVSMQPTLGIPEVEPFRALDSDRLRITGKGSWDATSFLSDGLAMAYRYPDVLLVDRLPSKSEYPSFHDPASEVLRLAKLWDSRGLLFLHRVDLESSVPHEAVRVFNAYKDGLCDRQIGDRRGRNSVEARVTGPSSSLPAGSDLADLVVKVGHERLSVNITDRSDFYHQFWCSDNRKMSNSVFPSLPLAELQSCAAFEKLGRKHRKKSDRLSSGDALGFSKRQAFPQLEDRCLVSFAAIFQGDHAGVEIATDAHVGLLQRQGLLVGDSRLEADRVFRGQGLAQGLVIDDYFAVGVVSHDAHLNPALECFMEAQAAYERAGLAGSPHKDVVDQRAGKVIGAALNSSENAEKLGVCTLGSPLQKRIGLSIISLALSQLPSVTDALMLSVVGGWTSMLGFRRPLMSILSESFKMVPAGMNLSSSPKIMKLPRKVASELTLLSVLSVLAVTDLGAQFAEKIFASDASLGKGGIVSATASPQLQQIVSRSCKTKGAYSRLLTPHECMLQRLGFLEELHEEADSFDAGPVERVIAFKYDFLEVYAGAATVTAVMVERGFSVCAPIDITFSKELDCRAAHVIGWITWMLQEKRLLSVLCEPPCTAFSVIRRPALRDRSHPLGFNVSDEQTACGNILAYRSFQIAKVAWQNGITCLVENPASSKMKWLKPWRDLSRLPGVKLCRADSCAFGSIHKKGFAFLSVCAEVAGLSRKCSRDHFHVPVEGKYTKKSATYVRGLSVALADVMELGVRRMRRLSHDFNLPSKGLENMLANEVLATSSWELEKVWSFKGHHHINLLELSVVERVISQMVCKKHSERIIIFVDSNVVRCSVSKGRSSSRALMAGLKRIGALCVALGAYVTLVFSPTGLNPADDPTRDVAIRGPIDSFIDETWTEEDLYQLGEMRNLRRWTANWSKLVLKLLGRQVLYIHDRSLYRQCSMNGFPFCQMDFDATLGYPGEGPSSSAFPCATWVQKSRSVPSVPGLLLCFARVLGGPFWSLGLLAVCLCPGRCHGVLDARNSGDRLRMQMRGMRPPILPGRPVLDQTAANRRQYFDVFLRWCVGEGIDFEALLAQSHIHIEEINQILSRFGRDLYDCGRPYNHYAETLNSVSSRKPVLRRQLQQAWDLAYSWVREEPSQHRQAMPWQVLLSLITVSLTWGWTHVAGMLALSWGALLRPGEFLAARRSDLLLPSDTKFSCRFCLLSINEPKTRYSAARHQTAKLDMDDLVQVVELCFGKLEPTMKLWPFSPQTMRTRFKQVLAAAGQRISDEGPRRTLELGSLRPGGATWMLQVTESGELVQRRGRWMNYRVMSIYLQEMAAAQYLLSLSESEKVKMMVLAEAFPTLLVKVKQLHVALIPPHAWYRVLVMS